MSCIRYGAEDLRLWGDGQDVDESAACGSFVFDAAALDGCLGWDGRSVGADY